jgi:RNA-directed DNA polymerase
LWLLDTFIDHPVPWTENGKGIPIGNLTSQHFANFYLSGLDHFIKEYAGINGYIRYMDDLLLFSDEKETLWDTALKIEAFLIKELLLRIKKGSLLVAPVFQGISFLGFRIFPNIIRISRKGWRRFRRKVLNRDWEYSNNSIDFETWQSSMSSLLGHMRQVDTRNLRASFFHRPGAKGALTA